MQPTLMSPAVKCSNCNLRDLCMPVGLTLDEFAKLDTLVSTRQRVAKGGLLFRHGDAFKAIYAIRTGTFKTRITTADGRDQVTGFHIAGEIIGLDGLGQDYYACDTLALENAEVCVIPYDTLGTLSQNFIPLQKHMHRIMGKEIVRNQNVMMLLANMRAEERLAAFLLNLTQRMHDRGFSRSELVLRMTRQDIGSYLGLKLETISRVFSRFVEAGLISVQQRHIKIEQAEKLQQLVDQTHLN